MIKGKRRLPGLLLLICCLFLAVGCSAKKKGEVNISTDEILAKVQEAYGDDYLPNTAIDAEMLESICGLDMSLVQEFSAQMPMIGFHPDRVIIIRAADGKGADVETQLKAYRQMLVDDSFQYPANIAKTEASVVVRQGDYAAFLLVGAPDDRLDASEEDQLSFAKEENQKAVDAFNSFFE